MPLARLPETQAPLNLLSRHQEFLTECERAVAKLDTGDYSVAGLEEVLCIERKKSVSEIANNIVEKRYKDWTKRMSKYKYKFLMLEFDLDDVYRYPRIHDVPK